MLDRTTLGLATDPPKFATIFLLSKGQGDTHIGMLISDHAKRIITISEY